MAADVGQLVLVHQRTQNVLAELAAHLQLRFVIEQLEQNAVNATTRAASERRTHKTHLTCLRSPPPK